MSPVQHRDLAAGRWWELSLAEQLGNIGSEISRASRWASRNPELANGALERALELFDLALDDPRHRQSPPRRREIARAREVVLNTWRQDYNQVRPHSALQDRTPADWAEGRATHVSLVSRISSRTTGSTSRLQVAS